MAIAPGRFRYLRPLVLLVTWAVIPPGEVHRAARSAIRCAVSVDRRDAFFGNPALDAWAPVWQKHPWHAARTSILSCFILSIIYVASTNTIRARSTRRLSRTGSTERADRFIWNTVPGMINPEVAAITQSLAEYLIHAFPPGNTPYRGADPDSFRRRGQQKNAGLPMP